MFLFRLDDACEYMNVYNWDKIECIFDKYNIKPIVAVIPHCEDKKIKDFYNMDLLFWKKVKKWQEKGWEIAMHGYNHVYTNFNAKGLNKINNYSEFSGIDIETQSVKIKKGIEISTSKNIYQKFFVAPAHSFDENTLVALKNNSNIKIISDSVARDIYYKNDFYFIPQQCGNMRKIYFVKIITRCYHPIIMNEKSFNE